MGASAEPREAPLIGNRQQKQKTEPWEGLVGFGSAAPPPPPTTRTSCGADTFGKLFAALRLKSSSLIDINF